VLVLAYRNEREDHEGTMNWETKTQEFIVELLDGYTVDVSSDKLPHVDLPLVDFF
jgi:hypothetical protein